MSLFLAVLVAVAFAAIVERTGLPAHAAEVMRRARGSLAVVTDRALTDDQKERRLRAEALRLFVLLGRMAGGSALALGLPLALLWFGDRLGWMSMPEVLDVLMRVDFIVGISVAGGLVLWWMSRRRVDHSSRRREDP